MKKNILRFIDFLHLRIFGHGPSDDMLVFLRDLGFVVGAAVISKILLFGLRVYGGNIVGSNIFGDFSFMLAAASLFMLPLQLFLQGSTKYIAETKDVAQKNIYFSSVFWLILILLPGAITLYYWFGGVFMDFTGLTSIKYHYVLLLLVLLYGNSFFEGILRAYNLFDKESIMTSSAHITMFIVFLSMSFYYADIRLFLIPYIVLYSTKIVAALLYLSPKIHFSFSWGHIKKIYSYGTWIFLIFLFQSILSYIDKVFLYKFLPTEQLGIFQAYYDSSIIITATIISLLLNVLSTKLFMIDDKKPVIEKLKKIANIVLVGDIFLVPILIYFIIKFGFHYPIHWPLIIAFTLLTAVSNKLYLWNALFYTYSIAAIKKMTLLLFGVVIFNIIGNYYFVPQFGLIASVGVTILSELCVLIYVLRQIKIST